MTKSNGFGFWVACWGTNQIKRFLPSHFLKHFNFPFLQMKGRRCEDIRCGRKSTWLQTIPRVTQTLTQREEKGAFLRIRPWRFDIREERDFKKWTSTLINQWSASSQTSKPSMQRDGSWARGFADESGERMKRGQVQALGGGRGANSCIPASTVSVKVSSLETLTFDPSRDAPMKTQFQTALTRCTLQKHEMWAQWRNAGPPRPPTSACIMACVVTQWLSHTHSWGA